ncbi:MAG: trypsin-like peptidase domain-containing protein [Planctomycetales bacterium]|nr:trypsin-like peptidase domain-containing protein [Planctomycetales bacterium]
MKTTLAKSLANSRLTLGLTCCLLALSALAPRIATADATIYQQALRSTTWVLAKNSDGTSSGTGVLVDLDRKLVVTNAHVVGDARAAVLFFADLSDGQPNVSRQHYLDNVRKLGIRGRVVAVDRKRDLALVQLDRLPDSAVAIDLASESIGPGEAVDSIGNPGSTDALWVYTSGTVRTVYRKQFRTGAGEHDFKVVETQSPINSGDSGGPGVNSQGQLVAVAQAIAPNARLVSYCVDISEVKEFLASPWKPAPLPVTDVLKNADLEYSQHSTGHYEVKFDEKDDQKISVFVTKDIEYYERADVRKIWALARVSKSAPSLETTMKLLEQSARTKIGSWMVERNDGGEYLIIYCVKLDATAAPDAMKSTMQYVAKLTASMKKELTPKEQAQKASDTLNEWLSK